MDDGTLEKVINYCDALNETFIDVSVRPRKEQRLFSSEAFKEAWINACVPNIVFLQWQTPKSVKPWRVKSQSVNPGKNHQRNWQIRI